MTIKSNTHIPVLINDIMSFIDTGKQNTIFDGTFGGGGYTNIFLNHGHEVYACDLDQTTIDFFQDNNPSNTKLHLENDNFSSYISNFEDGFFDIITLDLGYSSNQLEYSNRGFSYQNVDEALDLRYDISTGVPVYQKIRKLSSADELGKILFRYSGESFSHRIAINLYAAIKATDKEFFVCDAIRVVENSIPKKFLHKINSILSRVWQALRVWVNDEFVHLELFLTTSISKLKQNGVLMIVSFNSLEDKMVTKYMRQMSQKKIIDDFGNTQQDYILITKKAVLPSNDEIDTNRRSRSAMLRVLKKL
jgi:16S rRNA (cytosine1402-N4)-methyltransferase